MANPLVGVYPGTFDPVTNGHMDIIKRATRVVDRLVIGVAVNAGKGPMFSLEERSAMVEEELAAHDSTLQGRVEVQSFDNLLMHFVVQCGGNVIVRGLRAVSDFEYEFQMAGMNRRLNPDVETVFLTASEHHHFIASRLVKEISLLGGDITSFVSPRVAEHLARRSKELSS